MTNANDDHASVEPDRAAPEQGDSPMPRFHLARPLPSPWMKSFRFQDQEDDNSGDADRSADQR